MIKFKIYRRILKILSIPSVKKISGFLNHYFIGLIKRTDENHLFLSGGGIAFSVFVCIIPLTLILFSVLGNILDSESIEEQVNTYISTLIPYKEYAEYTAKLIMSRIPDVIEYKTMAAYIGAIGLLFAASSLFSSMRTVLNKIFGVSKERSPIIAKLRDFGMILLLVVFILLSVLVLPVLNLLNTFASEYEILSFLEVSSLLDNIFSIASPILIFIMFFIFYYFIPYEKMGRKIPAISALWATILWELARFIFGFYIFHFTTWNRIYGTYAIVVVIAFWIYYSSVLFIIGAEIGQLFRERLELFSKERRTKKAGVV